MNDGDETRLWITCSEAARFYRLRRDTLTENLRDNQRGIPSRKVWTATPNEYEWAIPVEFAVALRLVYDAGNGARLPVGWNYNGLAHALPYLPCNKRRRHYLMNELPARIRLRRRRGGMPVQLQFLAQSRQR